MLAASFLRQLKKTREADELRNQGKKAQVEDDAEKEFKLYAESILELVDLIQEEAKGKKGGYLNDRELSERFDELLDDYNREKGGADQGRIEKGATLTLSQQKEMDKFVEERNKLLKELDESKAELKRQHYEEEVKLEKEFAEKIARLEEKYNHIG